MRVEAFDYPFQNWVVSDLFREPTVHAAHDSLPPPEWPGWVRYANDCERKRTTRDLDGIGEPARLILARLVSGPFVKWLGDLTGIQGLQADPVLHGAGVHVMDPGDHLNCHLDYACHPTLPLERRLSLILFLNPVWHEWWGGAFQMYDAAARDVVNRASGYPVPGWAYVFENSDVSYHGTERVAADAPPRVTAACYYLAPPRPGCVRRRALFVPNRGGT